MTSRILRCALRSTVVVCAVVGAACTSASNGTPNEASAPPPAEQAPTTRTAQVHPTEGPASTVRSTTWVPDPGTTWQYQLTGTIDVEVDAQVFDVDLFDTDAATVDELHRRGRHVVCYLSAGSFEDWRPDSASFDPDLIGSPLDDWPGEAWLDVRQIERLAPIMAARLDLCVTKGFDAVEADNVDGYTQDSGFPLTAQDQLAYNRTLAQLAHERGLSIGLKNDLDQVADLVDDFDFAVNESCEEYDECEVLRAFTDAGKAVLHVEYIDDGTTPCPSGARPGFSTIVKRLDLDAWRSTC